MKLPFLRRFTGKSAEAAPRPIPNSYWVQEGRFLAGEYPGSEDPEEARERIDRLLAAGVNTFVDLTEAHELEPYRTLLPASAEYERMAILDHGLPRSMDFMHDILALIADALARDRVVYVHCHAGIGRTGVVVGGHLILQGLRGEEALKELNRLWKQSARAADWRRVPETEEQQEYLLSFAPSAPPDPLLDETALSAAQRLRNRFHGALFGLALGDALAAPTQMAKSGSFGAVGDLIGGGLYDLPRGAWTDDTAMALCLAESLLDKQGFDAADQVARYAKWQKSGYLSATGECVGITASTARALGAAHWRRQAFGGSHDPKILDPEPLARIAPAVLYFFADRRAAVTQAAEAARATNQAPEVLAILLQALGVYIIQIDKTRAGQGLSAGLAASASSSLAKVTIVVDKDVNIYRLDEIMASFGSR